VEQEKTGVLAHSTKAYKRWGSEWLNGVRGAHTQICRRKRIFHI